MKTILIPTDFSENAGDALAYAIDLIGREKALVHIVNVSDPAILAADESISNDAEKLLQLKESRQSLEALEVFSKARFGTGSESHIRIVTHLVGGAIAPMIRSLAKELDVDLIIMGTQGVQHDFVEKRLGTVSTTIFKNAPCPVILVPRAYVFKPISNILFATNLNHSDPYALWKATELIKPHIGVVRCLHVVEKPEDKHDRHLEEFAKYMIEHSPSIQTIFTIEVNEQVEAAITEYADTYSVELIIMHKSKHPLWERLLKSGHTKNMASQIKVPLLVMNEEKE
ncbi:MAG: universal stress protein [Saprospiraceae bacterium]|nr:universal stress protein [Saprospiraceae bacterium]